MLLARTVQQWRNPSNPIDKSSPSARAISGTWRAAIVAPSAERAPVVCAQLLKLQKPFACLVPSELVSWIPVAIDPTGDEDVKLALDSTRKLPFLSAGFAWIIAGDTQHTHDQVFSAEISETSETFETNATDKELLLQQQRSEADSLSSETKHVVRTSDGMLMHAPPGELARVIVPAVRRKQLTLDAHERILHRGWKKTLDDLRMTFFWKAMSKDVKNWVEQCEKCFLAKRKRNLAHGQFSVRRTDGPRIAWLLDYVKMAPSEAGHNYWLTAMDAFTHVLLLTPTKTRTASEACLAIRDRIIFRFGVPGLFVSDEEKAFLSALMTGLEDMLGIDHVSSTAYNSKAIAALERAHLYLGECMRLLPKDQRPVWDSHGPRLEFAFNTVKCETTGFTPFELDSGMPARTVTSSIAAPPTKQLANDKDKAIGIYGQIRDTAALYHRLAVEATDRAKDSQLATLNRSNKKPKEFQIGQRVAIYLPGRDIADWRPKHTQNWAGPCKVTARESTTVYEVEELSSEKTFRRHVCNMAAWPPTATDAPQSDGQDQKTKTAIQVSPANAREHKAPSAFQRGRVIAFADDEEDSYWIGDVLHCIGDTSAKVHYRATQGSEIKTARFLPVHLVHVEYPSGLSILTMRMTKRKLSPGCTSEPWTGVIDFEDVYDFNVQLTGQQRLTARSRKSLSGRKHMIMK